jgi:hypothetical protein
MAAKLSRDVTAIVPTIDSVNVDRRLVELLDEADFEAMPTNGWRGFPAIGEGCVLPICKNRRFAGDALTLVNRCRQAAILPIQSP